MIASPERLDQARASSIAWQRVTLGVYGATIFLGAGLVFLVQPMVAKMVLPEFGGTPAVWNTAMVFFQAVLLAGYLYAHLSTRALGLRRQPFVHLLLLLLPLLVLPVALPADAAPPLGADPAFWLLRVLVVAVALPYFLVTTTSPLMQRWFSGTDHPSARDPYFLYAAGNAGSLLALLGYPLLVEPYLTLGEQSRLWTAGYAVFAVLTALSGALLVRARERAPALAVDAVRSARLTWRLRVRWIAMAFVPSSLMLGVTTYLSTDIASVPLLWVLPLSVYLLTFILAFARRSPLPVARASMLLPFVLVAVLLAFAQVLTPPVAVLVLLQLGVLFVVAMLAHGRLADERPAPDRLTEFYVLLSVGGVLGGIFNALVAPEVFSSVLEYPLILGAALLLRPGVGAALRPAPGGRRLAWALDLLLPLVLWVAFLAALAVAAGAGRRPADAVLAAGILALLAFRRRPLRFAMAAGLMLAVAAVATSPAAYSDRTFFGVLRVIERGDQHILMHGTTQHGFESFAPGMRDRPEAYYAASGPAGQVFTVGQRTTPFRRVGVVGLGAGSLAAYGRPGQRFTFYEIDPGVVRIAEDPRWFTFMHDSRATLRVVVGDGRLELRHAPDHGYDLLALDAFSSDAVPAHLLTVQALRLYLDKLAPSGRLLFHISNRHLDLEPVLASEARALGLAGLDQRDLRVTPAQRAAGKQASEWVLLARDRAALAPFTADPRWRPLHGSTQVWTDDFSNILGVIDWTR